MFFLIILVFVSLFHYLPLIIVLSCLLSLFRYFIDHCSLMPLFIVPLPIDHCSVVFVIIVPLLVDHCSVVFVIIVPLLIDHYPLMPLFIIPLLY
jgi:hypothetical protein